MLAHRPPAQRVGVPINRPSIELLLCGTTTIIARVGDRGAIASALKWLEWYILKASPSRLKRYGGAGLRKYYRM